MRRAVLAVALVASLGWAWRAHRHAADAGDAKILFHRFWIDHMPTSPQEKFQVLFVNGEMPFGHYGVRDAWTANLEFFHYHMVPRADGELDFLFGRTNERQRVKYAARSCHEQGFDFCLEIRGSNRGVQRYYSKKEWGVENVDLTPAER
jgi:hypothetical protein